MAFLKSRTARGLVFLCFHQVLLILVRTLTMGFKEAKTQPLLLFHQAATERLPFPIALECGTGQQAFEAKKILQLLAEDWNNKPDLSVFLQALPHNVQLKELAISMECTSGYFIVVLLGQIGGIYLSRRRAASSLSKSSAAVFRDVVLYSSFIDALQGMMTFGDHLPGQFYRGRSLPDGLRSGHLIVGICSAAVEKSSEICIDASEVSFIGLSYNADAKSAIVNLEPYHQSPDLAYAVKFLASLVSDCLDIRIPEALPIWDNYGTPETLEAVATIDELAVMFAMARPRDIGVPPSQRNDKDLTAVDWHDYRSVLCMGKGQHIGNISHWLSACWNHRPGHFCNHFGGFLTPRLNPELLVLEKLVVQYEATGCAWVGLIKGKGRGLKAATSTCTLYTSTLQRGIPPYLAGNTFQRGRAQKCP
ncbi:hypothetical protein C8J56DRAFT_888873 [Mycena floridula]|nr:hypothetical protein C8J56DRAFT_888873 [Mycena floridula]